MDCQGYEYVRQGSYRFDFMHMVAEAAFLSLDPYFLRYRWRRYRALGRHRPRSHRSWPGRDERALCGLRSSCRLQVCNTRTLTVTHEREILLNRCLFPLLVTRPPSPGSPREI